MSVARHHADWLSLIDVSGPFLSMPVLMRVFPQGLDQLDPGKAKDLRLAYANWQEKPSAPGRHRAWVDFVFDQVLQFPSSLIVEGQAIPSGMQAVMTEYGETIRPDLAIVPPAGQPDSGSAPLLIQIYPPGQDLDSPVAGKHWKASPATRMTELLHASGVALGLATNGEQWMLVFAPRGETTGYASWYASLWQEEPITLRSFYSLLHVRRFFGVAESDTLRALLQESAQDQQEVTDQLGYQVRRAVEVLVQAFDLLDQNSGRKLLAGIDERTLYEAALTVMMRLVFLFCAEERHVFFPSSNDIYDDCYAASTLRERLRETADRYGEEILERRYDAWARLLATFRAIHGGVEHENLRLIPYGGTLFAPDRYPFLEGRKVGTRWRETPADPLAINNRVVLHLLESLQILQTKVPGGGPAEARRLSFRGLDIEQIGHVYEGLLDHTAVRSTEVVLGLRGTRDKEPEIPLKKLEELRAADEDKLLDFLKDETGRSKSALKKAYLNGNGGPQPSLVNESPSIVSDHALLIVCRQDVRLVERLKPFAGLIREDDFGQSMVILPGCVYVTSGTTRRSTGTHYTPRSLTEPIVQHTLEPLVFEGPAEGKPKEQWRLKSPKEILALNVCDMTMGSGAFLVQACRYLSERLVEAWENAENVQPGAFIVTPEGDLSTGSPAERLLPKEAAERLAIARRFVADRCLFGVDINLMAVEMAKLSLWLITMQRDRPFTFLDHALKRGDSLLGISSFKQLETFSLDNAKDKQVLILSNYDELIRTAIAKRRELEMLPSNDAEQIDAKKDLNEEAEERISRLKLASDLLVTAELTEGNDERKEMARAGVHLKVSQLMATPLQEFRQYVDAHLDGRHPFQWPLEFPEVFERGGFHAILGNPPFMGGSKITNVYGDTYRDYLLTHLANGLRGKADLCAYFFLRALFLLTCQGSFGLMATNSISQGDNRVVGLDQMLSQGVALIRANPNVAWPGAAGVTIGEVWGFKGKWSGACILDGQKVDGISSFLSSRNEIPSDPEQLAANLGIAFRGTEIKGLGFTLEPIEAARLISMDPKNTEVLFPYITGEDLNSSPDQSAARMVINFHDWSREKAQQYTECFRIVTEKVKPYRETITKQIHEPDYWKFWDKRIESYARIKTLERVLARSLIANRHCMAFLPTGMVFSHKVLVFGLSDYCYFAVLQSSLHEEWARVFCGAALRTDMSYSTKSGFETFPFPKQPEGLNTVGEKFYQRRRVIMLARQEGLTKTYNRFHDPDDNSIDITQLRALQVEMDQAVAAAYVWPDLCLGHGLHETKQGIRFTISEPARRTVLDRLLKLNHKRYEEEVKAGLHDKKKKTTTRGRRGSKSKNASSESQTLFVK